MQSQFFKLVQLDAPSQVVAIEYWAKYKDLYYLYADLYLDEVHLIIVQFVKFKDDFTVMKTRHYLIVGDKTMVSGGINVDYQEIHLQDDYYGFKRDLHLPFKGQVLHPIKIVPFLKNSELKLSPTNLFTFVDWRSIKNQLDIFNIKKVSSERFKLMMRSGIVVDLQTKNEELAALKILFKKDDLKTDALMIPSSAEELERQQEFKFNYIKTLQYLNWADDFK